jgi:hypothetical protein
MDIPFGWHGIETGEEIVIYSPDEVNRIILRVVPRKALKQNLETYAALKSRQPGIIASAKDLPDGSATFEVTNVKTETGNINANLQVFMPIPNHPDYLSCLTLRCRQKDLDKYKGMVGLMLRDRKIDQNMFETNFRIPRASMEM